MNEQETLSFIYKQAIAGGYASTQKEFAELLGINKASLSAALNGNEKYLTKSMLLKATAFYDENMGNTNSISPSNGSLLVIPASARGGTLGDFSESVKAYDCERMISPIKGADYAIQVTGDSMAPEYPSGSQVIIKKVDESAFIEWGKVYVLDTDNGAVIKRINATENPEEVECVSINPEFGKFRVKKEFIRGWYRVLMCLSLK